MKLKNQVCSQKLSEKLYKLGVKQESEWYWYKHGGKWKLFRGKDIGLPEFKPVKGEEEIYSAFTVAELGEMLKEFDIPPAYFANGSWWAYGKQVNSPDIKEKTEANARAKMLIYLLENKLINFKNES